MQVSRKQEEKQSWEWEKREGTRAARYLKGTVLIKKRKCTVTEGKIKGTRIGEKETLSCKSIRRRKKTISQMGNHSLGKQKGRQGNKIPKRSTF